MPLPLMVLYPVLAILTGYGVKKGVDAKKLSDQANSIGTRAQNRFKRDRRILDRKMEETNEYLLELGKLKLDVFQNQIAHLVTMLKRIRETRSTLKDYEALFSRSDIPKIDRAVATSLELSSGLVTGTASGAMVALGAYGGVGMLATASTGTAIGSLSGAAATNATLAWLGGGTLAAGGGGVAAGTVVLGGMVAAPTIAIAGLVMATKAEKSLTQAIAYEADIDRQIADMNLAHSVLGGVDQNVAEVVRAIAFLAGKYDEVRTDSLRSKRKLELMLRIGKALKVCLDQPVLKKNGAPVANLKVKLEGLMEI